MQFGDLLVRGQLFGVLPYIHWYQLEFCWICLFITFIFIIQFWN